MTVIIPAYNRGRLLARAIRSVLTQTFQDLEVVVVDDCSVDDTEEVARAFREARVTYVRHAQNRGVSAARNTGIRLARGEYVGFLDSDNAWLPQKLEQQLAVFRNADSNVGLVYAGWHWVSADGRAERERWVPDRRGMFRGLPRWRHNVVDDLLVRASLVRGTPFNQALQTYECADFVVRLAKQSRFGFVREVVAMCYHHGGSRVSDGAHPRAVGIRHLLEAHGEFIRRHPGTWGEFNLMLGVLYLRHMHDVRLGRRYVWEAAKARPFFWKSWVYGLAALLPSSIGASRSESPDMPEGHIGQEPH